MNTLNRRRLAKSLALILALALIIATPIGGVSVYATTPTLNEVGNVEEFELETVTDAVYGDDTIKQMDEIDYNMDIMSEAEGCEIDGTHYATFDYALAAVEDGQTIKLLNHNYSLGTGYLIDGKSITIDVGAYNLNVETREGSPGLEVINGGRVDLIGSGEFNVDGGEYGVRVENGTVTVTNVTGISAGVYADNGTITVKGNVTASGVGAKGAYARNKAQITIDGDCIAENGEYGVHADTGSNITIGGHALAQGTGAYARNDAQVNIGKNAQGTGGYSYGANALDGVINVNGDAVGEECGVFADGERGVINVGGNAITTGNSGAYAENKGTVWVKGNVQGGEYGARVYNYGKITVDGNVITTLDGSHGAYIMSGGYIVIKGDIMATGSESYGAYANGGGSADCTITVDGTITAPIYVSVFGKDKVQGDTTIPTSKEGYDTYHERKNTVWVKVPVPLPDNVVEVSNVDELNAELTKVTEDEEYGDGLTIRLKNDITRIGGDDIYIDNKTLTIDLNGHTLDILPDGSWPYYAITVYGGELKLVGSGALNVTGYRIGVISSSGGKATVTNATGLDYVGAYIYDEDGEINILENVQGAHCGVVVDAENSKAIVGKDAIAMGSEYYHSNSGVDVDSGEVEVKGNVIGVDYGVLASYGANVIVKGNVTANGVPGPRGGGDGRSILGWDGVYGVSATRGSKVTVDGEITAPDYIQVGEEERSGSTASRTLPTTKEGYFTFSDNGDPTSTVWVKERPAPTAKLVTIPDQTLSFLEEGYASGTQEVKTIIIGKSGPGELKNISVNMNLLDQDYFAISYPASYTLTDDLPTTSFTVSAKEGLEKGTYTADVTVAAVNIDPITFKVTQEIVEPGTTPSTKYALTVANGSGSGNYEANTPVLITANPAPQGKVFDRWTSSGGGTFADATSSSTTFTMPAETVTVTATYKDKEDQTVYYTITASAGIGGSISPSGSVKVSKNGNQTFSITANSNYRISSVMVDGVDQGAISSYTFSDVTANHTISASFTPVGGGGGGSRSIAKQVEKPTNEARILNSNETVSKTIGALMDNSTKVVSVVCDFTSITNAFDASEADANGFKTIKIDIPEISGTKAYEIVVPTSFWTLGDGSKTIEIKTGITTVKVPENMFNTAEIAGAKNISLIVTPIEKNNLEAAMQPLIDLSLKIDGKQIPLDVKMPMTVAIPYKPSLDELEDPEHIIVQHIDQNGNVIPVLNGRYDAATGTVTFNATHLGRYAVCHVHKTFDDLDNVEWARKSIEILASQGIINGTSANTFSPNAAISRADYLVLLTKTLGLTAEFEDNFDDVKPDTYYYQAVGIAKKLGITAGKGNNLFGPRENISQQDMMVLTVNALNKLERLNYEIETDVLNKFSHKGDITRAEAAVFLQRIYSSY